MVKKTIAILGDTGSFSSGLMEVLLKQDLRLLFISEDETKKIELKEHLNKLDTHAEIEYISCEREGCWEADIIAIRHIEDISALLIQKIKEVATQKTMLIISEENETFPHQDLEKLLPNSKVIEIHLNTRAREFTLSGKDVEAKSGIRIIFQNAGYNLKT